MKYWYVIAFSILLIVLNACESEKVEPKVNENIKVEELPAQESWNSKVIFTDSGRTSAIMHVGHVRMYTTAQETLIDSGLKVDFYNEEEIKTSTLTSDRGKVDDRTKDLYAFDNVIAADDSGTTLKTEKLMWRNHDRKIVTDQFVTIKTPTEVIKGYGFESDQTLKNYIIYRITYMTNTNPVNE